MGEAQLRSRMAPVSAQHLSWFPLRMGSLQMVKLS